MESQEHALERLIAENIDALVNLDVSGYGVIGALHRAARAHHGEPLAALAARRRAPRLSPGRAARPFLGTSSARLPRRRARRG